MATLTIEFGKKGKSGKRLISFLVCAGTTKKRIPTEIYLLDEDMSGNGKRIVNPVKARLVEEMRRKMEDRLFALSINLLGREEVDAAYIAERLVVQPKELDFFTFADEWLERTTIKGKKNYQTMLKSLEKHLGRRVLPFSHITYNMLQRYSDSLSKTSRAQSLYLGEIRHLYREAMKQYNNDYETVIKSDPFQRFSVPRQQMKKGVRSLTQEELMKIYAYKGAPGGRAQLARDCFILSFCLMGMNSADMYECTDARGGVLRYNRVKTRDRRADGAYIEVKVHPVVQPLMKRYKDTARVFNFFRRYSSYDDLNKAINLGLKVVGEAVGIKSLQFYQARHTFATLSRNLMKFSKSDVDEALNHVGDLDIADVYIKKDFSIINENNFKLLDEVFGVKAEP